jgi:transposase
VIVAHILSAASHCLALRGLTPLPAGPRNDVTQLIPLIDAIPPIRGKVGKPLQRPRRLYADRGYDHDKYRRLVRARGITPVIARRGVEHGSGLGTIHWPVERTFAWLKTSAGYASEPNAEPTCIKPSSAWPAP